MRAAALNPRACSQGPNNNAHHLGGRYRGKGGLAMTYFHERGAHYHWRRGVSRSCSRWEGVGPPRYGRQTKLDVKLHARLHGVGSELGSSVKGKKKLGLNDLGIQGYRVKPYGQLVLVSLTRYRASTPSLSTSWSSTTLQGGQASGRSHLQASFTLRCFQRLSLPHLATRRYDWRHNRYTRGASTPVLSY